MCNEVKEVPERSQHRCACLMRMLEGGVDVGEQGVSGFDGFPTVPTMWEVNSMFLLQHKTRRKSHFSGTLHSVFSCKHSPCDVAA